MYTPPWSRSISNTLDWQRIAAWQLQGFRIERCSCGSEIIQSTRKALPVRQIMTQKTKKHVVLAMWWATRMWSSYLIGISSCNLGHHGNRVLKKWCSVMDLRNVCWIAHGLSALLEDEFLQATNQRVTRAPAVRCTQRALHRVRTGAYPLLVWLYI